ncbi:MAG: HXXEE domain-containing protein [Gemmatimonadota bacterium]
MPRLHALFLGLVTVQAAHSLEEYVGRLWEVFPPATFLTGLISADHEIGFLVINIGLVLFGFWCLLGPVRRGWPSARTLMWAWVAIELINGIGHPAWAIWQSSYTPGLITAPALLVLALLLIRQLRSQAAGTGGPAAHPVP